MDRRNPWDEVAQTYEDARPSYPDQLIDDIISGAGLSSGDCLLEIGAGTGKATVQLARRGFRIHCVEPGRNLADILVAKCSAYPNVTVDVAYFEEWTPIEDAQYDLIFCAQAFNWLDPEIRFRRCYELLRLSGHLALFWYGHEHEQWESEIAATGLFERPQVFEYHSHFTSSVEDQIRAMESVSSFAVMDQAAKDRLRNETRRSIEQRGGSVDVRLNYQMYLAKRL